MRTQADGSCVALRNGACSIYEVRPMECRQFERGSRACHEAQRRFITLPHMPGPLAPAHGRGSVRSKDSRGPATDRA